DLDHVVRGRFLLASGRHADVTGFLLQIGQRLRPEVAHAGLNAAHQVAEHVVHRTGNFLERLDALGGDLAHRVVLVVTLSRGRAGLHRGVRTHAAVLFVELAGNFHDFARRFTAAGEQAAEDDRVGEGERLDDVARLRDAAVGDDPDAFLRGAE